MLEHVHTGLMVWWRRLSLAHRVLFCVMVVGLVGEIASLITNSRLGCVCFALVGSIAILVNFGIDIREVLRVSAHPRSGSGPKP